jgi:uncharacterized protein with NAD-binding domain and iron-sulfur cluster
VTISKRQVKDSGAKKEIAVLGGGVGGLAAAYHLTATQQLRDRHHVTVYQLGWRLGGKGASGRNADRNKRIEEHGLHVWFGFYDNAFRLMRGAYEELGREPGTPLATFDDAFHPCDQLVLYDQQGDGWYGHRFDCPRNFLRPGDAGPLPTFWEIVSKASHWALAEWRQLRGAGVLELDDVDLPFLPDWFESLASALAGELRELPMDAAERVLDVVERLAQVRAGATDHRLPLEAVQPALVTRLLKSLRDWLWLLVRDRVEDEPRLRFFFTSLDAGVSMLAGIVEDGVLENGFDVVNHLEWCDWLRAHGAKQVTLGGTPELRSAVLRSVYDVAFGYPAGHIPAADVAAGTATSDLLKLAFNYRGSIMYKMQAGMGDAVFTPLFRVLEKKHNVTFKFFHAVTGLEAKCAADNPDVKWVDKIELVEQASLRDGAAEYFPLVDVEGLECWPSEPLWKQLQPEAEGHDFELELNPLGHDPHTLERRTEDKKGDFDEVVLAIPVGALKPKESGGTGICDDLINNDDRFAMGISTAETVKTQAFQLWANRSAADLGWTYDQNSVAGCYVEPLDTYCDMSHLIPRESWSPSDEVRTIAYFCGVLDEVPREPPEPPEPPADAAARVHANAIDFIEGELTTLWPNATGPDGLFDWDVLVDGQGGNGAERFDAQYWRANVTPTDQYVLTKAGSVEHRLPSDESGFENLSLAGDWTRNGIDGGCVEAAVISGIEAAARINGVGAVIPGRESRWLRPAPVELPAYVEFGGRATTPPPFLSEGGRLRGYVIRGDSERIADLVERMFDIPAGGAMDYRSLGSMVLLLLGGFERVTCLTPPFDNWGSVKEIMATFWVPVLAGRDLGDVFVADRFVLAVPYIFVDNPMSYLGGRETYGYAKTMGRFEPCDAVGEHVTMETFGGNFGLNEPAGWRPFLEVKEVGGDNGTSDEVLEGFEGLVRRIRGDLPQVNSEGEIVLPGVRLTADLLAAARAQRVYQLFLKQFRDAHDGTRACYQSVVEAPVEFIRTTNKMVGRDAELTIHQLDSHPIGQELGVTNQRAEIVFDAKIDMLVQPGVEVARPAAAVPSSGPPAASGNGYTSIVEVFARRAWREYIGLERAIVSRFRNPF